MKVKVLILAIIVISVIVAFFLVTMKHEEKIGIEDLIKECEIKFKLESSAFKYGEAIPSVYTCDGENSPPPLKWNQVPERTAYFVLIVYDPDAPRGTFIHWILYNIPGELKELKDGVGVNGKNDFGKLGYGGPCPPPGPAHRYYFVLFALDTKLELSEGASLNEVLNAMHGHVLGYGITMGKYSRG